MVPGGEARPARPRSVALVGWVLVAAGGVGFAYHAMEASSGPPRLETVWVLLLRVIAVVAGAFLLRGAGWARWVALAWMAYHTVLSAFHSAGEAAMHAAILAAFAFGLLRRSAAVYFRSAAAEVPRDGAAAASVDQT